MAALLFRDDPYLATATAQVTAAGERGIGAGRVRLVKIPGIDLQPCGGTHVKNIGEIEGIRVLKIRSEGKRNRRVEIALG